MFIDIHTHAYRKQPPIFRFQTPEQLIERYDKMKTDMAVLLPIVSEFEDRLYFGTDMCGIKMEVELDSLLLSWRQQGKISETAFRKIAYENAEELLGL